MKTLYTRPEIAVMGLAGIRNYGDNFILDCVSYLVDRAGRYRAEKIDLEAPLCGKRKILYMGMLLATKILPKKAFRAKLEYLAVRIRCGSYYRSVLRDRKAVILGCGSFKYGTQRLWAYYSLVVKTAEELGIPVMFNAMNIQVPDWKNWKCRFLSAHANMPCVRMITSRDGEAGAMRLRNEYHIRKDIVCAGVGDAAFWIPECYRACRHADAEKVGINLIYGDIFIRYGGTLTKKELLDAYCGLLQKLDADGIEWELFTNGLPSDYRFGKELLKQYGNTQLKIRVPESARELLRFICRYKAILGARMHTCICAYSLDIPFIGFIWDEKLLSFSRMAKLQAYFAAADEISADCFFRKLTTVMEQGMDIDQEKRKNWKFLTFKMLETFQDSIDYENEKNLS